MSTIRDTALLGGSELGVIVPSVLKDQFMLRTGREYLLADYPDATGLPNGLMPVAIAREMPFISPLSTKQGIYVGRGGQFLAQVSKTSTTARLQISVNGGDNWTQHSAPATFDINSHWKFALAADGLTIFAWWFNNINGQTHVANLISYDNGATFVQGVHTALAAVPGALYSGSTVLAAAFSADSQVMYVVDGYLGLLKAVRTAGEFSSFTVLNDPKNFGASNHNYPIQLYVLDDISPADPAYGNIVFVHENGVITWDAAGNVIADEVATNGGPSGRLGTHIVSKKLYTTDGGITVRYHGQSAGVICKTEANDLHDLLIENNRVLVAFWQDNELRDNGSFNDSFAGRKIQEIHGSIDGSPSVTLQFENGDYALLAPIAKDPAKFYIPEVSSPVGPRGESLAMVRV
ncbi:hypothetical protein [Bowmanella denitrificans]|uniref:hypothetical protein n=1 Tax=Bowmanella denitrificans TaxID=366582 RepID=UPI000C9AD2B5|nr:hypothetical protein [Bowmanella denitrificans]